MSQGNHRERDAVGGIDHSADREEIQAVPGSDQGVGMRRFPKDEADRDRNAQWPPPSGQQGHTEPSDRKQAGEVGEFAGQPIVQHRLEQPVVDHQKR